MQPLPNFAAIPASELLSLSEVEALLLTDAVATQVKGKGLAPKPGDLVGVRLNLNVLKTTGKAIQTIHRGTNKSGYKQNKGFYNGEAIDYAQAVVLKEAYFNVSQVGREAIASGQQHKFAMASVDGEFVSSRPDDNFDGVEVRFNPKAQHLFVDSNNEAVHSAEEVVVLGNRVYARGVRYHNELTAPKRAGDYPSQTLVRPNPKAGIMKRREEETQGPPVARRSFG